MACLSLLTFLPGRPGWSLGTAWLLPKGLPAGFTGGFRRNEKPSFHPHFENAFKQYSESFELRRRLDDKEVRQALSSDPAGSLGPVLRMAYLLGSAPALRGRRPPRDAQHLCQPWDKVLRGRCLLFSRVGLCQCQESAGFRQDSNLQGPSRECLVPEVEIRVAGARCPPSVYLLGALDMM